MKRRTERRKYPLSFKQDALRLSDKLGVVEASDKLDIPLSTLQRWRCKKHKLPVEKSTDILRLQMEIKKMKRELTEKEAIISMLKKATAFFSRETGK